MGSSGEEWDVIYWSNFLVMVECLKFGVPKMPKVIKIKSCQTVNFKYSRHSRHSRHFELLFINQCRQLSWLKNIISSLQKFRSGN
jgi:hypothetical protein